VPGKKKRDQAMALKVERLAILESYGDIWGEKGIFHSLLMRGGDKKKTILILQSSQEWKG